MGLPDEEGALLVDPYFGTLRPGRRPVPGEYLVSEGRGSRTSAPGDAPTGRCPNTPASPTAPKRSAPARAIGPGLWQDGRRLVYVGRGDDVLWEDRSDCRAFVQPVKGSTVSYFAEGQSVWLGAVRKG
ncbi:hypothetical protein GCM10020227_26890 [Streptomyces flavovirens]